MHTHAQKLPKVSHAEPLYFDLVRDLGARKGEKEFDAGMNFTNIGNYSEYGIFAEYEFAPVNRLGLEAETDFSFFRKKDPHAEVPENKLECIKLSGQYSFFVSTKHQTTLAIGYTQYIAFTAFKTYGKEKLINGTIYNPFIAGAKRWGNLHTLIIAGPMINNPYAAVWQINSSLLYTIPHSSHFIGVEFNKEISKEHFSMTIRPQVKIKLTPNIAVGLVAGFPLNNMEEGFSSFFRIIYEY